LLFRGGDAIETAAGLRAMLFDKTGTLTRGRPLVAAVQPLGELGADRLVQLAASLETGSRHPLGFALLQEAQRRGLELLPLLEAHTSVGQGVVGCIDGQRLRVGRLGWVEASPAPELLAHQAQLERHGASVLAVAGEQGLLGLVAVEDQPRPDAAAVLADLRGLGLELGLLSGDRREPVQQLGAQLGLREAELAWELRPEQKLERILQHPARGALAMVGDGINDAPALAAADLGIAVGTGTQIAQDTADLVVMGDQLDGIVRAVVLARQTMAKVRQNLAWAFGYNLIVLPLAAGVLLPGFGVLLTPPLAALLMAMSSITVVVNALLLQDGAHHSR
jgi:Cu2+-exporting ATPase